MIIASITILLVGFIANTGVERHAARSYLQGVQAEFMSQMGTDTAMAQIKNALQSGTAWYSQPGSLTVYSSGSWVSVSLSSGSATDSHNAANLNRPDLESSSQYPIAAARWFTSGSDAKMPVQWIYVNSASSSAVTLSNSCSSTSVGRFGYWVDDECTRVNFNTAWKHGNRSLISDPSQVSLSALGISNYDDIQTFRSTKYYFNSLRSVQAVAGVSGSLAASAFLGTVYNHSENLNLFGEPRIILTTQKTLSGSSGNFLDILNTNNADPGLVSNLDANKVSAQVSRLTALLTRTDWPFPGLKDQSIASKYNVTPQQLAINIIEYVRSRESSLVAVEPIRGQIVNGTFNYTGNLASSNGIAGNARGPRITEFGIYVSPSPVNSSSSGVPRYLVRLKFEVYLPIYFGISSINLAQYKVGATVEYNNSGTYLSTISTNNSISADAEAATATPTTPGYLSTIGVMGGNATLSAGGYKVVVCSGLIEIAKRDSITFHGARIGLLDSNGVRVEIAPTIQQPIPYTMDASSVAEAGITTRSVDDPSINKNYSMDWSSQGANTLESANSTTLGSSSLTTPQQDTDNGVITDAGMHFPSPKGQSDNVSGVMQSVAELGYVHTGIETVKTNVAGVPWRTFHLQPGKDGQTLPDWMLMDLFCVPIVNSTFFTNPVTSGSIAYLGGKVNLNAVVKPFTDGTGGALLTRTPCIEAVLKDATSSGSTALSSDAVAQIATNIVGHVVATGSSSGYDYGLPNGMITAAQIAEIQDVASGGESTEALLQGVVDLFIARGNVFSIYTVGQSIRQQKSGAVTVLGERRGRTVVEWIGKSGSSAFRTVYSEKLESW
ncbi:MAG: hypothetical protein ACFUZC_10600 [Chthoniobacteraceae bacterium]